MLQNLASCFMVVLSVRLFSAFLIIFWNLGRSFCARVKSCCMWNGYIRDGYVNPYYCDDWWRLLSALISSTLCCTLFVELKSLTLWHVDARIHLAYHQYQCFSFVMWFNYMKLFVSIKWILACNFFRNVSQVFSALPTYSTTPQIPQNPTSPENSYHHCIQRQCQLHAQPACWKWPDQTFFSQIPKAAVPFGNRLAISPLHPSALAARPPGNWSSFVFPKTCVIETKWLKW